MKYAHTLEINHTVLQIRLVILGCLELSALYAVPNHKCDTAFCMDAWKNNRMSLRAFTTLIKLPYFPFSETRFMKRDGPSAIICRSTTPED